MQLWKYENQTEHGGTEGTMEQFNLTNHDLHLRNMVKESQNKALRQGFGQ